ncbi:hypothetical protein C3L33_16283, partial [Rhododendron williamsianum]
MFGTISQEIEVNVPASQAWELYGTLQLAKLAAEQPNSVIDRVEVVQGDGKVGSWNHPQHSFFTSSYKEKFTKDDDEKRVKEAEAVEGGDTLMSDLLCIGSDSKSLRKGRNCTSPDLRLRMIDLKGRYCC